MERRTLRSSKVDATPSKSSNGNAGTVKKTKQVMVRGVPANTYRLRVAGGIAAGIVVIGVLSWLLSTNRLSLSGNVKADQVSGLGSKLEFTFKMLALPLIWVLGSNATVCLLRLIRVQAIDPLNYREELIEVPVNVLSNSIEQLILTAFGQLAVVIHLNGPEIVRIIPLVNFLFIIGRTAYALGYPKWRSFGFTLTALPSALLIVYAAWNVLRNQYL